MATENKQQWETWQIILLLVIVAVLGIVNVYMTYLRYRMSVNNVAAAGAYLSRPTAAPLPMFY